MFRAALALCAAFCVTLRVAVAPATAATAAGVPAAAAPAATRTQPVFAVLHVFAGGTDGSYPHGGLAIDPAGNLYGATYGGGSTSCDCGVVFKLTPPAAAGGVWAEQILHVFAGGADGAYPYASVALDPAGNLFGTTTEGGFGNYGTVFALMKAQGGYSYATIHRFTSGADGADPTTGVIPLANGTLIGTAMSGGSFSAGIAYQLVPPAVVGAAWTERLLHTFQGGTDGAAPVAISLGRGSVIHGTTQLGGGGHACLAGCGTVFSLAPAAGKLPWTETIDWAFATNRAPTPGVVEIAGGSLVGAVAYGGGAQGCAYLSGCGRVFTLTPIQLSPGTSGAPFTLQTIYRFSGLDGANPSGGLTRGRGGVVYGTTSLATPTTPGGTIFAMQPPGGTHPHYWREQTLFSTNTDPSFGVYDFESALIPDKAGALYGTAQGGKPGPATPAPLGVVFRLTP